ncbi:MAG TPA: chemotaxis response regulator protein-glutamate methylesterase [Acidobacteriaceae bacterium]|nr:chemotaxis response regulator protein-glutamate methylesterase [Acidobacteriaceae bacterium]
MSARKIRVLVVDDSAIVRKVLTEAIATEPDIEVIATAPDAYVARDKLLALRPDVITLDIEMPRMDGLTFLRQLMFLNPIPTLVVSSQGQASCAATFEALRCGAVDVIAKPATHQALRDLRLTLAQKIRGAAAARPRPAIDLPPDPAAQQKSSPLANTRITASRRIDAVIPSANQATAPLDEYSAHRTAATLRASSIASDSGRSLIAIGASTGGTVAIQEILTRLPSDMPPILITQHIPPGFTSAFADRLNRICAVEVREAVPGDFLRPGLALLAPGDHHLVLRDGPQGQFVDLDRGPEVCYLRPSVDVMFLSIAESTAGPSSVAVLLTGMGADGARGMLALKQTGAATIAQDEASSVVYGMPREAVRIGAADTVAPLSGIPALLTRITRAPRPESEPALQEIYP